MTGNTTSMQKTAGVSFEQKLGQMADGVIRDRFPAIIPYRVGFELLDKNEQETRAFGVYAAILNKLWLYIPVFFIEGKLEGVDMMFVKNTEMFVPSKDNWINVFREQGVEVFGTLEADQHQLDDTFVGPNKALVEEGVFTYATKTAQLQEGLISEETLRSMIRVPPKVSLDLMQKLAELGESGYLVLGRTMMRNPEFANAMFTFYQPADIADIGNAVALSVQKRAAEDTGSSKKGVTFITQMDDPAARNLEDRERKVLFDTGIFAQDDREEFSRVFNKEVTTGEYTNPTETGVYRLLMADGSSEVCLVVTNSARAGDDRAASSERVFVISDKAPSEYFKVGRNELFGQRLDTLKDLKECTIFGKEATKSTISEFATTDRSRDLLLLLGARAKVECSSLYETPEDGSLQLRCDGENVMPLFGNLDESLSVEGKTLFIPKGTRFFAKGSQGSRRQFGDLKAVERLVFKSAGLQPVSVCASGSLVDIMDNAGGHVSLTMKEAMECLTLDHGIFAGQAQSMIKEARRAVRGKKAFLIKHAAAYGELDGSTVRSSTAPRQEQTRIEEHKASIDAELPAAAVQKAVSAAEKGQKDVFDTTVLSSLIHVADISELRRDYVAGMIRNMNEIGRMRFILHWHRDTFEERYGDEDLFGMKQTLKQLFEQLGDVILFFQKKQVFSPDLSENMTTDLARDVGTSKAEAEG